MSRLNTQPLKPLLVAPLASQMGGETWLITHHPKPPLITTQLSSFKTPKIPSISLIFVLPSAALFLSLFLLLIYLLILISSPHFHAFTKLCFLSIITQVLRQDSTSLHDFIELMTIGNTFFSYVTDDIWWWCDDLWLIQHIFAWVD